MVFLPLLPSVRTASRRRNSWKRDHVHEARRYRTILEKIDQQVREADAIMSDAEYTAAEGDAETLRCEQRRIGPEVK